MQVLPYSWWHPEKLGSDLALARVHSTSEKRKLVPSAWNSEPESRSRSSGKGRGRALAPPPGYMDSADMCQGWVYPTPSGFSQGQSGGKNQDLLKWLQSLQRTLGGRRFQHKNSGLTFKGGLGPIRITLDRPLVLNSADTGIAFAPRGRCWTRWKGSGIL